MEKIYLEDVFCDSGIPEYTFVEPKEYTKTMVALRSKGRGVVVEGPSGIGKTTCIKKILSNIGLDSAFLSARKQEDKEMIDLIIQSPRNNGVVIIDDFHLLDEDARHKISDILKVFADEAVEDTKLVLVGINRAGECLVQMAPDLNNRIDTIKFEKNPEDKILELIEKGEKSLNVTIADKHEIAHRSFGSFHIAQMLCKTLCVDHNVTECQVENKVLDKPCLEIIMEQMQDLSRVFQTVVCAFSSGNRNRRSGILPYLHLLMWLSESDEGAIRMDEIYQKHSTFKQSVSQIADKGYLSRLLDNNDDLSRVFHYEKTSKLLAIEDPKFIFYLKNIDWEKFIKEMGFKIENSAEFDIALSFAGEKREYAELLYKKLVENEISTFYDKDHSAAILGNNVDDYLAPIYRSGAKHVVVLLDSNYPKKVWTVFESDHFKERMGGGAVIPILFNDVNLMPTDPLYHKGFERIDDNKDKEEEMSRIADLIKKKLELR